MIQNVFAFACALALAGCSTPGARDRYDRLLTPTANPSDVVATELAFARAAQEDGQWTAFREFATDDAVIFGRNGAIEAQPWLKAQKDPEQAVAWEPYAVWSSCDGSLAVTQGGFREPNGRVGVFNTVWQRQRNGAYKWVFDFGFPTEGPPAEPEIIAAEVAKCGEPALLITGDGAGTKFSRDKTLAWHFELLEGGTRTFNVFISSADGTKRAIEISAPPSDN